MHMVQLGNLWDDRIHGGSWHRSGVGGCPAIHSVVTLCVVLLGVGNKAVIAKPAVSGVGLHRYSVGV